MLHCDSGLFSSPTNSLQLALSPITGTLVVIALMVWSNEPVARLMIACVAICLGLALIRFITGWKHALVTAPFYFLFLQAALAVGSPERIGR